MKSLSSAVSAVAILTSLATIPATAQPRAMGPPASADIFANAAGNSSRMALEQHACSVVMGLHQPGDLYDTCVRSLNKTLSELDRARLDSTETRARVPTRGSNPVPRLSQSAWWRGAIPSKGRSLTAIDPVR